MQHGGSEVEKVSSEQSLLVGEQLLEEELLKRYSIHNPQMSFGAGLADVFVVHSLRWFCFFAFFTFAILRSADFDGCADKSVKGHHRR